MSQEELMTMLQTLEASLGVELTDTEIGDLRNAIYGLFAKRAQLAEAIANIKPDDTLYDLWYSAGQLTFWASREAWLAVAEANELVEGKDYAWVPPGAVVMVSNTANDDWLEGESSFTLELANLPPISFSPRDFGADYGHRPPIAYDCFWFMATAPAADLQGIGFTANTENGAMPDDWLAMTSCFKIGYIYKDQWIQPPAFDIYAGLPGPGFTYDTSFESFDARPGGMQDGWYVLPPIRAEVAPGKTQVAAYTMVPPTPTTCTINNMRTEFTPSRVPSVVGTKTPSPVPSVPVHFDLVSVKILHDVGVNVPRAAG